MNEWQSVRRDSHGIKDILELFNLSEIENECYAISYIFNIHL